MRLSSTLSLLALAACGGGGGGDHEMDVVFDACEPLVLAPVGDVSDAQYRSVERAAELWNALGTTRLTTDDLVEAPRLPIRFVDDTIVFGQYDDEAGEVMISDDIDGGEERAITVAHEVGHALGLWHVSRDRRRSVMNDGNLEVEPNDADNREVLELWGACPES